MKKDSIKEYIQSAIDERDWKIIHLDYQTKWMTSKEAENYISAEHRTTVIDGNDEQRKILKAELAFFKAELKKLG